MNYLFRHFGFLCLCFLLLSGCKSSPKKDDGKSAQCTGETSVSDPSCSDNEDKNQGKGPGQDDEESGDFGPPPVQNGDFGNDNDGDEPSDGEGSGDDDSNHLPVLPDSQKGLNTWIDEGYESTLGDALYTFMENCPSSPSDWACVEIERLKDPSLPEFSYLDQNCDSILSDEDAAVMGYMFACHTLNAPDACADFEHDTNKNFVHDACETQAPKQPVLLDQGVSAECIVDYTADLKVRDGIKNSTQPALSPGGSVYTVASCLGAKVNACQTASMILFKSKHKNASTGLDANCDGQFTHVDLNYWKALSECHQATPSEACLDVVTQLGDGNVDGILDSCQMVNQTCVADAKEENDSLTENWFGCQGMLCKSPQVGLNQVLTQLETTDDAKSVLESLDKKTLDLITNLVSAKAPKNPGGVSSRPKPGPTGEGQEDEIADPLDMVQDTSNLNILGAKFKDVAQKEGPKGVINNVTFEEGDAELKLVWDYQKKQDLSNPQIYFLEWNVDYNLDKTSQAYASKGSTSYKVVTTAYSKKYNYTLKQMRKDAKVDDTKGFFPTKLEVKITPCINDLDNYPICGKPITQEHVFKSGLGQFDILQIEEKFVKKFLQSKINNQNSPIPPEDYSDLDGLPEFDWNISYAWKVHQSPDFGYQVFMAKLLNYTKSDSASIKYAGDSRAVPQVTLSNVNLEEQIKIFRPYLAHSEVVDVTQHFQQLNQYKDNNMRVVADESLFKLWTNPTRYRFFIFLSGAGKPKLTPVEINKLLSKEYGYTLKDIQELGGNFVDYGFYTPMAPEKAKLQNAPANVQWAQYPYPFEVGSWMRVTKNGGGIIYQSDFLPMSFDQYDLINPQLKQFSVSLKKSLKQGQYSIQNRTVIKVGNKYYPSPLQTNTVNIQ
jgi:hypothetical protein